MNTLDEQARLMAAAKTVADKVVLIMQELGMGATGLAPAAEHALSLESVDLQVLKRRIQEAGKKTNWGIA